MTSGGSWTGAPKSYVGQRMNEVEGGFSALFTLFWLAYRPSRRIELDSFWMCGTWMG